RAYATNNAGTAYGNQVQFTTSAGLPPTVTTLNITDITAVTASGGGNVTSEGGTTVSARGVCWSTNQNPTISNSFTIDGNGTGSFNSNLTNLAPLTNYYVRAYATNMAGTSYGTQVQFTTVAGQVPTVSTTNITNISDNSASSGGNVTAEGTTTVIARGVCWNTSPAPTLSNNHTTNGNGTGSFTSSITGLLATTSYYVRAYATNSIGTAYGNEVSFTTLEAPPVVTNGLVAYYTFDQQNANDWTGNYNGVVFGGLTYSSNSPDSQGYSTVFDGSSAYISIGSNPLNGTSSFSVNFWIKTQVTNGYLFCGHPENTNSFNIHLYYGSLTGSYPFWMDISSIALDNQWHLITLVRSYSSSTAKIYIDSNLIETITAGGTPSWGGGALLVGRRSPYYGTDFYQGQMDNIRLYNRDLSVQEIQQIYNAQQ
ncbi:MAG: LamG-like jellyroll fold domain-containing protein, partial [Bacteroidales bacterium]